MDQNEMLQFCQRLPKVELLADVNTSYSFDSLNELITLCGGTWDNALQELNILPDRHMEESFKFFPKVQQLVTTEQAVYLLTKRVITEYASDNIKYLELRSVPKEIPETNLTRELYMRTMIRAAKDCEKEGLDILVRFLASIDRGNGLDVAMETVELAHKLKNETDSYVVGIAFGGDAKVGNATDYIPVFIDASRRGLKMSLRLSEQPSFDETKNVLKSLAKCCEVRIGHGTFLHTHDRDDDVNEVEEMVTMRKIPIELSLASNIRTMRVPSMEKHQFKRWLDKGHPIILGTDGKGVYSTTLSQEYAKAAKTFNLTKEDLKNIAISAIDYIFEGPDVKLGLKEKFRQFEI